MPSLPCSPSKLRELARTLRQNAAETSVAHYIRLMTHAADELEETAAKAAREFGCDLQPRA